MRIPILKPGFFQWIYKGKKVNGLDLHKVVRDVLRDCGYPCIKCDEPDCTDPCSDTAILNPNIREEIDSLKAKIKELETIINGN